jgi:hypothetical protein
MALAFSSPFATARLERARSWLAARAPAEEVLVVSANTDAASELIRGAALESASGGVFGWYRCTLRQLAANLAKVALIERSLVPVTPLCAEAVVARVVNELRAADRLGRYAPVATTPGFARAVARTLEELRLGQVPIDAGTKLPPELCGLLERYDTALAAAGLADWAVVLELAVARTRDLKIPHELLGLPTLLLDVPLWNADDEALVVALADRAPDVLALVPAGDEVTAVRLRANRFAWEESPSRNDSTLARLQYHLFEDAKPPEGLLDDSVVILSAPGESRECVEIARRLIAYARGGVSFDRMAVLLRSPDEYRPHLEEAFARAGIPTHFARGAVRPDSTGRAFLALLACAAEGLSARRFAEYLSLSEVPDATSEGLPQPAAPTGDRWVPPDDELVPEAIGRAMDVTKQPMDAEDNAASSFDTDAPVVAGTLRAPRRWERLLVDAAVIGGRERWTRRLVGLAKELELDLQELDDPEDPAALRIQRQLVDLAALRDYALPLIDELASFPERVVWGEWIDQLSSLATRALRHPERVLAVLGELAPMAAIGPVDLAEVRVVLSQRLLEIAVPPPTCRYGCVFVAPAEVARGLSFDVVCVPGLAEKLFPREIREDPILLDLAREGLGGLLTNQDRVRRERLALRLAVGAATRRLVLSYPRIDLEKARPRVPSFYGLEAVRAGEGRLPGFDELAKRAEMVAQTQIGWPAPTDAKDAIDEAEHDLALLEGIRPLDAARSVGMARYLLTANPHLGRALRFRARRWLTGWTGADGLVDPCEAAAEVLRLHRFVARSYSATALENYAICPYRFLLQAVHRLAPREEPEAIDTMDALQRGSFVHEVQFEFLRSLQDHGQLPVTAANLDMVCARLDQALDAVAERFREELAPAIDRVWRAEIEGIRADLREWLRRMSEDDSGFVPWRFELAFGLPSRRERDPHSLPDAVPLDCGIQLRGSIDLVERDAADRVRVTDHKTGKVWLPKNGVFKGGTVLQPILYALAAEKVFPDVDVVEGRLYHCTAAGGFEVRSVPLGDDARASARALADGVDGALREGFLPAFPDRGACDRCDYNVVCGPYEERRTRRKRTDLPVIAALLQLRDMP